jgi:TPR repeat protein
MKRRSRSIPVADFSPPLAHAPGVWLSLLLVAAMMAPAVRAASEPRMHPVLEGRSALLHRLSELGLDRQRYVEGLRALAEGDNEGGLRILETLAAAGYVEAQFRMGMLYSRGTGVRQDRARALEWFRRAAAQGHHGALFNVGVAYASGLGVERDMDQAVEWWRRAALRGNPDAQFNMGAVLYTGHGVERDLQAARAWWTHAASQGDAASQYRLGLLYMTGEGGDQDPVRGLQLWRRAARQGYAPAVDALNRLHDLAVVESPGD